MLGSSRPFFAGRATRGAPGAAIADVRLECAQAVAAACGVDVAVDDHRRLLERPDVEAVLVCSSTDTHARIIEEAASAGKHVFCEKPIDLDLERARGAVA